ncbi:MAG: hypothetical protein K2K86_03045, partial [Muribaculaceae bacterium]|nr:hypothetical protein [Muribaculaceae bacterium]
LDMFPESADFFAESLASGFNRACYTNQRAPEPLMNGLWARRGWKNINGGGVICLNSLMYCRKSPKIL